LTLSFFHCKTGGYFLKSRKKFVKSGLVIPGGLLGLLVLVGRFFFWDSGTETTRDFEGDGSKQAKANPKMMINARASCPSKRMGAKQIRK